MSRFDKHKLSQIFDAWSRHKLMLGILTSFGNLPANQLQAKPSVRWERTRDTFRVSSRQEAVIHPRGPGKTNQLSVVESKLAVDQSVILVMSAVDDDAAEDLRTRCIIALQETLVAMPNYRVVSGDWLIDRAHNTYTERYALQIVVEVPIFAALPAVIADDVQITQESA